MPDPRSSTPAEAARGLTRWMVEDCLPFWAGPGVAADGAFEERFHPDGTPDAGATRRVRVQARQIYTYAHAELLGWHRGGAALALRAFDVLMRRAHAPGQGFCHTLRPDGAVADPLRDAYDHAFLVLAMTWLHRATGEARVAAALADTLAFVDRALTAPDGSLLEGLPPSLPRRQNPQMHWYEAMQALAAHGHPEGLPRARRVRALFDRALFDAATGTLTEYFDDAWAPAPGEKGAIMEPGHLAEWVWLLRRHDALEGRPPSPEAGVLLDRALGFLDPATGLLVDEVTREGRVLRGSRRSWLQTELIKAWLAEAEAGRPGAAEGAAAAIAALRQRHLGRPWAAAWVDQLDAAGGDVPGPVPASTLYHVFVAVAEADRVLAAP